MIIGSSTRLCGLHGPVPISIVPYLLHAGRLALHYMKAGPLVEETCLPCFASVTSYAGMARGHLHQSMCKRVFAWLLQKDGVAHGTHSLPHLVYEGVTQSDLEGSWDEPLIFYPSMMYSGVF